MPNWPPTQILRHIKSHPTGAEVIQLKSDAGEAYLKGLGNAAGPHALACEWIGTGLAELFGLPVFDYAILDVTEIDELPFASGGSVEAGPAFVTRAEAGMPWGGAANSLKQLVNPVDISRLVVFDTWTLNCDRYKADAPEARQHFDNVFLSYEGTPPGKYRLIAMDHTHCFTCGNDLTRKVSHIASVKDETIYGLFPVFEKFLEKNAVRKAAADLKLIEHEKVNKILSNIPDAWNVSETANSALDEFICQRAALVADTIVSALFRQGELGE